jgi:hypothetical protein
LFLTPTDERKGANRQISWETKWNISIRYIVHIQWFVVSNRIISRVWQSNLAIRWFRPYYVFFFALDMMPGISIDFVGQIVWSIFYSLEWVSGSSPRMRSSDFSQKWQAGSTYPLEVNARQNA